MTFWNSVPTILARRALEHEANSPDACPQQSPQMHFYSVTQEAVWAKMDKACDRESENLTLHRLILNSISPDSKL